ncbi:MAG TPA: DUF4920 domain-containing protein [Thermoanaerobaculia bacterium]|nr:DUF4920 domain-containing protein [Thermoanaerobaculia bacterium]
MVLRVLFLLLLLPVTLATTAGAVQAQAQTTYGAGVEVAEETPVARILADPDAYVGKKVRIEGKVTDVCPMAGCWMELDQEGKTIKVKVDDGVIVFPTTAKGQPAVAEGVVESIPMTKEKYVDWLAHLAEEKGEKFDPSTVGDGPFRILQIKGTGARIGR